MPEYDAIVVGLGGMGSSAAYHLARRGQRVLGLDAFARGHLLGSSHGETRIIRMAYFEHSDYVPLLRRAYELWAETERAAGVELLRITGGLYVGRPDCDLIAGSLRSAVSYGLAHTVLDSSGIRQRFPALRPLRDEVGLFEDGAGILFPERCIEAHLDLATAHGAELHFAEPVQTYSRSPEGVHVLTSERSYTGARLVLAAGARLGRLLPEVKDLLVPERIPLFWFEPLRPLGEFPILIWHSAGRGDFYSVPHVAWPGVKVGKHHSGENCDPDTVDRTVKPADEHPIRSFLERHIPDLAGSVVDSRVCLYENSPDEHFMIDVTRDGVAFAGGFSGHGFKFASVVGEILADLATTGQTTPAADFLKLRRLALST